MPSSRRKCAPARTGKRNASPRRIAERRRTQLLRRRIGATAIVVLVVVAVALGLFALPSKNDNGKVAVSPTSETAPTTTGPVTTTTAVGSVKGKPCVGLKDTLPKGAPAMLLAPGPAPTKLTTQDLEVGTGAVVPKNAKVTVNYVGVACSTGKIFDS